MYIQIDNAGFINKGAELMLFSIIDRLKKEKDLNPCFVKGLNCVGTSEQIMKAGLFKLFEFRRFGIGLHKIIKQTQLKRFYRVKPENVNIILDAGGFQFGDQWSNFYNKESNKKLMNYYKKYKKNRTKIVFLPQAFGPFTNSLSIDRIKYVFEFSDLIFAREKRSYDYLIQIFGENKKIKQAPDFTCLLEPDISIKLYKKVNNGVCIIPNTRMIDKTDNRVSERYIELLVKIASSILSKDEKLILLNHEGEDDWKLIEFITQKLGNNNIIALNNLDALTVKSVIGSCKLLISSRYHGAVSGINQGVPTFLTSWSHKYEELLKEYHLISNILDILDFDKSINKIINALDQPLNYVLTEESILSVKLQTEKMWKEILILMNS